MGKMQNDSAEKFHILPVADFLHFTTVFRKKNEK